MLPIAVEGRELLGAAGGSKNSTRNGAIDGLIDVEEAWAIVVVKALLAQGALVALVAKGELKPDGVPEEFRNNCKRVGANGSSSEHFKQQGDNMKQRTT